MKGMGLLPVTTRLQGEKVRRQVWGNVNRTTGIFSVLSGLAFEGYEIHMGRSSIFSDGGQERVIVDGNHPNVYGTYVHGIFDKGVMASALVGALAEKKGLVIETELCDDYRDYKEKQYDRLADVLSAHLDMEKVYGLLREAHI